MRKQPPRLNLTEWTLDRLKGLPPEELEALARQATREMQLIESVAGPAVPREKNVQAREARKRNKKRSR